MEKIFQKAFLQGSTGRFKSTMVVFAEFAEDFAVKHRSLLQIRKKFQKR
tara:strand:+ start:88 stop:234 length:147 start_codon:yes stop_codon:yes gene_type:complete